MSPRAFRHHVEQSAREVATCAREAPRLAAKGFVWHFGMRAGPASGRLGTGHATEFIRRSAERACLLQLKAPRSQKRSPWPAGCGGKCPPCILTAFRAIESPRPRPVRSFWRRSANGLNRSDGHVVLRVLHENGRVRFEVEDECGFIPEGIMCVCSKATGMGRPGKKVPMNFKGMPQADVPQGRKGEHKAIVTRILSDLDQVRNGVALKVPLAELTHTKEQVGRRSIGRLGKAGATLPRPAMAPFCMCGTKRRRE
jgi:hypothetical protein